MAPTPPAVPRERTLAVVRPECEVARERLREDLAGPGLVEHGLRLALARVRSETVRRLELFAGPVADARARRFGGAVVVST
jgi:hypothetical protein